MEFIDDNYFVNYWYSLKTTLGNQQMFDKSDLRNFVKHFPSDHIYNYAKNGNLNIMDEIINKYFDTYKSSNNYVIKYIIENINASDLITTFIKFYNDIKILDKLNPNHKILNLDNEENTKKCNTSLIILVGIHTSSKFINNNKMTILETYNSNPLIFYYLCCYLFFDYLIDDPNIDKLCKKQVVDYTYNLFNYGSFEFKNNLLETDVNLIVNYIPTIDNIFSILFNYNKNDYPELYKSMFDIFNAEAITSKYQTFTNINDVKDINKILECTLIKGRDTIFGVWQICEINKDFKNDPCYNMIGNHFGLIFQLLDDFIDIEQDVQEKNVTLFSYPVLYKYVDNQYFINNINKLINYLNNLDDIISDSYLEKKHMELIHVCAIFLLNYGISSDEMFRNMYKDYEKCLYFDFNEINELCNINYDISFLTI